MFDGYNSLPRIKKASSDNFKMLKDKLGAEIFEAILKFSFKSEANYEEEKDAGPESPSSN